MEKNKGGRPLKFKSVEELEKKIDEYFATLWDYKRDMWGNRLTDKESPKVDGKPAYIMQRVKTATVTGLALYLDTTRETLMDYENGKYDERDADGKAIELTPDQLLVNETIDKFSDTIKRAKLAIYDDTEQQLYTRSATGAIFSLKNNYGWRDKSETELTNPDGSLNAFGKLTVDELRDLAKRGK